MVKRGALEEEPAADDDAREETENSVDSEDFDNALEDSTEERLVMDGRKQVESVFSSEEDVRKSSVWSDNSDWEIGRKVCNPENPENMPGSKLQRKKGGQMVRAGLVRRIGFCF